MLGTDGKWTSRDYNKNEESSARNEAAKYAGQNIGDGNAAHLDDGLVLSEYADVSKHAGGSLEHVFGTEVDPASLLVNAFAGLSFSALLVAAGTFVRLYLHVSTAKILQQQRSGAGGGGETGTPVGKKEQKGEQSVEELKTPGGEQHQEPEKQALLMASPDEGDVSPGGFDVDE